MSFDGSRFIGTPPDGSSGTIEITVTASDGEFSVSDSFDLTIIEVDQPDESDTPSNGADTLIGTVSDDVIDGLNGNDNISGLVGNDILIGGRGSDILNGGAGNDIITTDQTNGANNGFDQDIVALGEIVPGTIGNDIVTDFDTDNFNGGENNFDTLTFTFAGVSYALARGRDFVDFVDFIESDGDTSTDAIRDGNDLIFVFARDENGVITDSITLEDVIGGDGITNGRLNGASIDELTDGDIFANYGSDDADEITGGDDADAIFGLNGDDTLIGGRGSDIFYGGSGHDIITTDQLNGANDGDDQDVISLGEIVLGEIGNDIVTDFDTDNYNGGENNFDTLEFKFDGVSYALSRGRDFVDFAAVLNNDNDPSTDALRNGDDLIFVFARDENGVITDSITLEGIIGDDGITDGRLNGASVEELSNGDVFGTFNNAPNAVDDAVDTSEDDSLTIPIIDLISNDFDLENNSFQITEVFDAINGSVSMDGQGNIIFIPEADYSGIAQFTYRVVDIFGGTDEATVTIDVASVNDAPVIGVSLPDVSVSEEAFVSVDIPSEAFSDIEDDDLTLTATLANGAILPGWLTFENGTLTGTPPNNFNGSLEINITASDGQDSTSQTFTLEITPVNDSPILTIPLSNRYVLEDADFDVALQNAFIDPEGDAFTLSATQSDGTALPDWLNYDAVNNRLSGRPPQDFIGTIAILITASDGTLSVSDSFDFTVVNLNDAPVVANPIADLIVEEDSFIRHDLPFEEAFLDVDGDALSYTVVSSDGSPLPEWLSFNNGTLAGQPPQDLNGDIALTVIATDGFETVETSFNIQITPVADTPVANADFGMIVNSGGELVFSGADILGNDFDPDGGVLNIVDFGDPENGDLVQDEFGNFVYTPDEDFAGIDSFSYTIENESASAEAVVNIFAQDNYISYDVQGAASNELLFGDIFAWNEIYGGNGITGGALSDQFAQGADNDLIFGNAGSNFIEGGSGNDLIYSGAQNDRVNGGTGTDVLFGGLGQDTFEFNQGNGTDFIGDFNSGYSGRNFFIAGDRIEIDYSGVNNFGDLLGYGSQDGQDAVFDFGNGDLLILGRTQLASLDDDAFTFV